MMKRAHSLLVIALVSGCGDSDSSNGATSSGGSTEAAGGGGASTGGGSTGGGGAGITGGGGAGGSTTSSTGGMGGSACYDPGPLEFGPGPGDQPSCLTFDGASDLCGFESDESICAFAVACGASADLSQCKINCEMGATVVCNTQVDVDCLIAASCANDCEALSPCGFIL